MEIIQDLVDLVSRNKLKSINLLGQAEAGRMSMVNSLYFKLASREFQSEEEAAQYYFGSSPEDHAYRKLKNQLKKRLVNAVFFIDVKQAAYSDWDRAYISCCKEWAAAKILFNRGAGKAAVDLALRIFKRAQYYQFSELLVNISKILRLYYSTCQPNARKFQHYDTLHKDYVALWQCENLAEDLYIELVQQHVFKPNSGNNHHSARSAYEQLQPLMSQHRSYHFLRHTYLLKVAALLNECNYEEGVLACEEAITTLNGIEFVPQNAFLTFLYQKLLCHIQLQNYPEGQKVVEQTLRMEKEGSFNWFKNRELGLVLALHTRNYNEARRVWQMVCSHPSFERLNKLTQEKWKIYEAWLHYLTFIGKLNVTDVTSKSKFRLNKFLNEVPQHSKDKRGMNVPILILQILFLLAQKRYDAVLSRIEAIERYCCRYLKQDENYRSNVFIRLLLQIPKGHFHPQSVMPRADRYLKLLWQYPQRVNPQGHEIEMVPYEDLWEMVWGSLGRRGT